MFGCQENKVKDVIHKKERKIIQIPQMLILIVIWVIQVVACLSNMHDSKFGLPPISHQFLLIELVVVKEETKNSSMLVCHVHYYVFW